MKLYLDSTQKNCLKLALSNQLRDLEKYSSKDPESTKLLAERYQKMISDLIGRRVWIEMKPVDLDFVKRVMDQEIKVADIRFSSEKNRDNYLGHLINFREHLK